MDTLSHARKTTSLRSFGFLGQPHFIFAMSLHIHDQPNNLNEIEVGRVGRPCWQPVQFTCLFGLLCFAILVPTVILSLLVRVHVYVVRVHVRVHACVSCMCVCVSDVIRIII